MTSLSVVGRHVITLALLVVSQLELSMFAAVPFLSRFVIFEFVRNALFHSLHQFSSHCSSTSLKLIIYTFIITILGS